MEVEMQEPHVPTAAVTRRRALRDLGLAGLGLAAAGSGLDVLVQEALAASPRHGSLADIDHVVILMQENRSFDHYFGTLSGVRGFGDHRGRQAFHQRTLHGGTVTPFHLRQACLPDISHDWGPQHKSWDGGRMDRFVSAREPSTVNGEQVAPETMGYYRRRDLRFYYALADAFTICDAYHCSVIGPTDPNRLMSLTATIDPAGRHGGPQLETDVTNRSGRFSWTTMPERLSAHGISWKVYTDFSGGGQLDNVLTYFKQYRAGSKLADRGLKPTYPADFLDDLDRGRLPKVSWLMPGLTASEHPGFSTPADGEAVARQVVEALIAHPRIWRRTALFLTWDENGGFFDHVAPPTPPRGTEGEWLTVARLPSSADGIRGPIGLGFRVPMLVVSPFSRGGFVATQTFDHTSTLRFLETRFGVRVPNLSHWRRKTTGDLTGAFNFAGRPRYGHVRLPRAHPTASCPSPLVAPAPKAGPLPRQERGRRPHPSGVVHHRH
jgi:phospholipase C